MVHGWYSSYLMANGYHWRTGTVHFTIRSLLYLATHTKQQRNHVKRNPHSPLFANTTIRHTCFEQGLGLALVWAAVLRKDGGQAMAM